MKKRTLLAAALFAAGTAAVGVASAGEFHGRPPTHYKSPPERIGGSTVDGSITVVHNVNGTKTVTTTDGQGKQTAVVKPQPSATPPTHYKSPPEPVGGSTVDGSITVVHDDNGTKTVTTTDNQGKQTAVVKPQPSATPPTHYKSPPEPIGGSTVDGSITVVHNDDGTKTVTRQP